MKKLLWSMALILGALLIFPAHSFAQQVFTPDTVVIAPLPPGNVNTVINSDTITGGLRKHPNRVYELKRKFVYQVSEPIEINGSVTIIDSGSTSDRPPVLAPQILQNNQSIDHFFDLNGKGGTVKIKNVYFLSVRSDGNVLGWSDGIRINADSVKVTFVGDIFDAFTHTSISLAGQWDKLKVYDCVFRNNMHNTSYFGGGGYLSNGGTDMDTTMFVNNTFFCNNAYAFSVRGYSPYAEFSHNTLVYGTVNPFLTYLAQNLHMDNNLFYSMHSYGGIPEQVIQSWFENYPDTSTSSIVQVMIADSTSWWTQLWGGGSNGSVPGPDAYIGSGGTGNATVTAAQEAPSARVLDLRNNDYFWPQKLYDVYKAYNDTVKTTDSVDVPNYTTSGTKALMVRKLYLPHWISPYARYAIAKIDSNGGHVDTTGNMNLDPGFSNTDVQNQINNMMTYVIGIATGTVDTAWYFNPSGGSLYPPAWPLTENLSYTNSTLMHGGTDGFAVGDLNWFPSQKSQWEVTDVKQIRTSVPDKFTLGNNYPNPFNPTTTFNFSIAKSGLVRIAVYNVLGQKIKTLIDKQMQAGNYKATWDGTDNFGSHVSSGVYFYRLESHSFSVTKKMILMK
jgi:hypothetical protein